MSSTVKYTLLLAFAGIAPALLVAAQGTEDSAVTTPATTAVPVNLNENIVTTVLILGVAITVTMIYVLSKVIPMCRSGELSFSKIEFDWRAELLNQTPKKEKARRAEEQARLAEERTSARYADVDEGGMRTGSEMQPRVELREAGESTGAFGGHHAGDNTEAHVAVSRQQRE